MGHVVNPSNFRLGTVKIWGSNIFLDFSNLKYHGYFAVISFNIFYFISRIFRSRFFLYVTSYIFNGVKLNWKFNKIICFVFLFNGGGEVGGYKTKPTLSHFFPNQKEFFKFFKKKKKNLKKLVNVSLYLQIDFCWKQDSRIIFFTKCGSIEN